MTTNLCCPNCSGTPTPRNPDAHRLQLEQILAPARTPSVTPSPPLTRPANRQFVLYDWDPDCGFFTIVSAAKAAELATTAAA